LSSVGKHDADRFPFLDSISLDEKGFSFLLRSAALLLLDGAAAFML